MGKMKLSDQLLTLFRCGLVYLYSGPQVQDRGEGRQENPALRAILDSNRIFEAVEQVVHVPTIITLMKVLILCTPDSKAYSADLFAHW